MTQLWSIVVTAAWAAVRAIHIVLLGLGAVTAMAVAHELTRPATAEEQEALVRSLVAVAKEPAPPATEAPSAVEAPAPAPSAEEIAEAIAARDKRRAEAEASRRHWREIFRALEEEPDPTDPRLRSPFGPTGNTWK